MSCSDTVPVPPMLPHDALLRILACLRDNLTIAAIKEYRQVTGQGLRESKDAVDAMRDALGLRDMVNITAADNAILNDKIADLGALLDEARTDAAAFREALRRAL